eukprot:scaffold1812_cov181-Alexandrium_tamarense.AAC.7
MGSATKHSEDTPLLGSTNHNDERIGRLQMSGPTSSDIIDTKQGAPQEEQDDLRSTIASVAGNVLELYDFAIYGYFSDIIGYNFFPPSNDESTAIIESFLVFGGAFFVRPVGGVLMGYVADTFSTKRALELSIFCMAFPTFALGCLPTFETAGWWSLILLVLVRLLQGLSVGGQLMSSLVFVVEGHERKYWGWYGSFAMTSASIGVLFGNLVGYGMRHIFTFEQLANNGLWRLPFLCGIFVSLSGLYLKHHVKDHKKIEQLINDIAQQQSPLEIAFSKQLRGSLASVTAVVILWAGGFYMLFVWLVILMKDLSETPVPSPFAINAISLFVSMVLLFPFAGWLSDVYGRKLVMTVGASGIALFAPLAMKFVSLGNASLALLSQLFLGICLCCYASPMCAWLVESFPANVRTTACSIGYNTAMALAGGLSPSASTWLVGKYGAMGAGYLLSVFAIISLFGLHLAPKHCVYR